MVFLHLLCSPPASFGLRSVGLWAFVVSLFVAVIYSSLDCVPDCASEAGGPLTVSTSAFGLRPRCGTSSCVVLFVFLGVGDYHPRLRLRRRCWLESIISPCTSPLFPRLRISGAFTSNTITSNRLADRSLSRTVLPEYQNTGIPE